MKKNKIVALLLALCMVVAVFPITAYAAPCSGGYYYKTTPVPTGTVGEYDYYATITDIDETVVSGDISIPTRVDGYLVTEVGTKSFQNCTQVTSVIVPDTVTKLGDSTFSGCTGLRAITLPDTITRIEDHEFSSCTSLASVTLGNSITFIDYQAFINCTSLTEITLPDTLTDIEYGAFSGCTSLTSITIPNKVGSIKYNTFYGCSALTTATIGSSVESIGDNAFCGCASLKSITVPDNVTTLGKSAFRECTSLTSAVIGNGVTLVNNDTFYKCTGLKSVVIGDAVTAIGSEAFRDCSSLETATIGSSVKSIDYDSFRDCAKLTAITLPSSLTTVGDRVFQGCSALTEVYYYGSEAQWGEISISNQANDSLKNANIHYDYLPGTHETTVTVKENEAAPTCSAEGSYDEVVYCADCDVEYSRTTKTTEKLNHTLAWKVTTPATTKAEGVESEYCTVCGELTGNTRAIAKLPVEYQITENAGQTVMQGKDTTFRSNADFAKFVKVTVDGGDVDAANYTVSEGSTVVTLKAAYTKTLPVGKHTIAIVSTDGSASTTFEVQKATLNNPFTDVKEKEWFYGDVMYAYENGLMDGTAPDEFSPNVTTTRGMIVTILWRLEGEPSINYAMSFKDVPSQSWYTEAVRWAASVGVVNGYSNVAFGPEDDITREQMAAILYRFADYKGYDVSARTDVSAFTDANKISGYALECIRWTVANGLINGKGNGIVDPLGNATRAEVSAILHRYCELTAK